MTSRSTTRFLALVVLTLAGCAAAPSSSTATAVAQLRPPPEATQFDFWIGEWNVKSTKGDQPAGRSVITKILGGWVIEENWTSASGSSGKSFNTYSPLARRWRQHWVDDSGTVTDYGDGVFEDGHLRFTSNSPDPDGSRKLRTMTFFDLDPERVRQLGEVSIDGGASWQVEFDLTYYRR